MDKVQSYISFLDQEPIHTTDKLTLFQHLKVIVTIQEPSITLISNTTVAKDFFHDPSAFILDDKNFLGGAGTTKNNVLTIANNVNYKNYFS